MTQSGTIYHSHTTNKHKKKLYWSNQQKKIATVYVSIVQKFILNRFEINLPDMLTKYIYSCFDIEICAKSLNLGFQIIKKK